MYIIRQHQKGKTMIMIFTVKTPGPRGYAIFFGNSILWYKKFQSWKHADRLAETRNSLTAEWKGVKEGFVEKHSRVKEKKTPVQK